MIKANSGTPGIMYKAANGSLAAITLLDTGATNPTSRLWSIYRWPGNIASAPTVASNTSNPATFTPPQDFSTYTVKLHRVETDASTNDQYLVIEVPDSTGRAIPSGGTDAALMNASQAMLDTGWAGGAVAGEKLLEQVTRDNSTGVDVLTAAVAVHETRLDADETDIANLTTTIEDIVQPYDKVRIRYTTNTTISSAGYNHIEVDTTGGAVTLTVPGSNTLEAGRFFEIVHVLGTAAVTLAVQAGHETDAIGGVVPYRGGVTLVNDAAGNWFGQNTWCSLYGIQIPNDGALFCAATQIIQGTSGGQINVGTTSSDSVKLAANDIVSIGVGGSYDSLTVAKAGSSITVTGAENDLKLSATASHTLDINGTKLGAWTNPGGAPTFTLDSARTWINWKANGASQYIQYDSGIGIFFVVNSVYAASVEAKTVSFFFSGFGSAGAGSGNGVLYLRNRTTAPTSSDASGGIIYEEAGALLHRGSSGTVTTIAPA